MAVFGMGEDYYGVDFLEGIGVTQELVVDKTYLIKEKEKHLSALLSSRI